MKLQLILLNFFNFLDLILTFYGVKFLKAYEANPITRYWLEHNLFYELTLIKILSMLLLSYFVYRRFKIYKYKVLLYTVYFLMFLFFLVIINNLYVIYYLHQKVI